MKTIVINVMKWDTLFILLAVFQCFMGTSGKIEMQPENKIAKAGDQQNYLCTSNSTGAKFFWYWSLGRQISSKLIANGGVYPEFQNKYEVTTENIEGIKHSKLKIKNAAVSDGGTITCVEMSIDGETFQSLFSVISGMTCRSYCDEDSLLVSCSYLYWGENDLVSYVRINESTKILAERVWQTIDSENHFIQQTFLVEHNISCKAVTNGVSIIIQDKSTNTTSDPTNITVTHVSKFASTTDSEPTEGIVTDPSVKNDVTNRNADIIAVVSGVSLLINVVLGITLFCVWRNYNKLLATKCPKKAEQKGMLKKESEQGDREATSTLGTSLCNNKNSQKFTPDIPMLVQNDLSELGIQTRSG